MQVICANCKQQDSIVRLRLLYVVQVYVYWWQNESAMDENGIAAAMINIVTTFCRVSALLSLYSWFFVAVIVGFVAWMN